MRSRGSLTMVPATAGALTVVALILAAVMPFTAVPVVFLIAHLGLIGLLTMVLFRTARIPGLPRPTARFWTSLAGALLVYALSVVVDVTILIAQAISGRQLPPLGSELIDPIAGLATMYAVFQYPTATGTRGERITVGLDAAIVLLGGGLFIWYYSVSRHWSPEQGWLALSAALALPAMVLVAGFGTLRVAFVGIGILAPLPLVCYAICVALAAAATALPDGGPWSLVIANGVLLLSQLSALAGALWQYRLNAADPARRGKRAARRPFSLLPYAASAAAFGLLLVVLGTGLDWRRWGVLGGAGLLLCSVTIRQITALRENGRLLVENRTLTGQLQQQAWYDDLTGLANRALYGRRVAELTQSFAEHGIDAALLLVDLDDFKNVNDTLGHDAGDMLLCEIAQRLTREVREADLVCRLGGDEFVVLLDDTAATHAAEVAERLVRTVGVPVQLRQRSVRVGASVGIAFVSESLNHPNGTGASADLLRRADVAMYKAKAAGKGGWRLAAQAGVGAA